MKRERTKEPIKMKNKRGRRPRMRNPFVATLFGCKVKWSSRPGSRCLDGLSAPSVSNEGCPNYLECLGFIAKQNWPGWVLVTPGPECPKDLFERVSKKAFTF